MTNHNTDQVQPTPPTESAGPGPMLRHVWKLYGVAGMDVEVERLGVTVTLKPVDSAAVFSRPIDIRQLAAVLEDAAEEVDILLAARPGLPAVVPCAMCAEMIYVARFDPEKAAAYYCKNNEKRECWANEHTWRRRARQRGRI